MSAATATRSQLALQSYLDALLQETVFEDRELTTVPVQSMAEPGAIAPLWEATETTAPKSGISLDEFEVAVREERIHDVRLAQSLTLLNNTPQLRQRMVRSPDQVIEPRPPGVSSSGEPILVDLSLSNDSRPSWAAKPFECLLFDVAGLTLAVPLVCLGSIYPLENQELILPFGQPEWFIGILPSQVGNLKVLDTARWVMPERYRDNCREGLKYVISVQDYEWGLAVHQVNRSICLDPAEVKWRGQRGRRPWLAGTIIEHMCALLDVTALAELIASGAVKRLE